MRDGGCDLHLHTNRSDGADPPESVVEKILQNGLRAFSITDHDNLTGIEPAQRYLKQKCAELGRPSPIFVPGVELSIDEEQELHLLGYFPRGGIDVIDVFLARQRELRSLRNEKMISLLQNLGYPISMEDFQAMGSGTIGRLQAAVMLRNRGFFPTVEAVFDELLGFGRPAYVESVQDLRPMKQSG